MSGLLFAITRAKSKASEVLFNAKRSKGSTVDVKALAESCGIDVRVESFKNDSVSGFLHRADDGSNTIVVNKNNPVARQRFTIAHELGHFFLHQNETMHVDEHETVSVYFRDSESSKATKINEIEANQFAAELLMPQEEIFALTKRELAKKRPMEVIIEELAEKYEVSITAMSLKLGSVSAFL